MGLDQYAFSADDMDDVKEGNVHFQFQWRKHAKLHEFMVDVFNKKGGVKGEHDFNCNPVELSLDDIDQLEEAIKTKTLPHSEGGCFWGHQFQDESQEEYRDRDLEFCQWARQELSDNARVFYDCWW